MATDLLPFICLSDSCKFNHDIKYYLEHKDKDLGDRCVNFDIYGEYVSTRIE